MKKRNERKDKTMDQGGAAADLQAEAAPQASAPEGRDDGKADCPDRAECRERFEQECRERFEQECQRSCKRNFWTEMLRTCAKVAGVILAAFGLSGFVEDD